MAIPWDATQHIQGIASGIKDAMPGIQAGIENNMPGDANIQRYLDEYAMRRYGGEPKESIIADLTARLQNDIKGGPQALNTGQVHSVGMQGGTPALGPQGGLSAPMSQPPNSFAPQQPQSLAAAGMNGPTSQMMNPTVPPPTSQPNQPTGINVSGGGFGGNTIQGVTPEDAKYLEAMNAIGVDSKDAKAMESVRKGTAEPISLTRKEPSMDTATGGKLPTVQNRGQQQRALAGIAQIEQLQGKRDSLDLKAAKQEQDLQLKELKVMADLKRNDRNFMLRLQELHLKTQGMDAEQQRFVVKAWIELEKAKDAAKAADARTNAYRARTNKMPVGADKIPPKLAEAGKRYNEVRSRLSALRTSGMSTMNKGEMDQLTKDEVRWRQEYNDLAKMYSWPPIDKDGNVPEKTIEDNTSDTPEQKGFFESIFGSSEE